MENMPKMKIGIVAVSRDCFPESLSVTRRENLVKAYAAKYDAEDHILTSVPPSVPHTETFPERTASFHPS